MDKYNIITPKASLPELEYEMNQWLQLPTDFKFRSNDDCIRLHGCTVPEYYNLIKIGLIKAEDDAKSFTSTSNLVKEDIDWSEVDLTDKIKQTQQVTNNPYIVIITPLVDKDELTYYYNNYLNLTAKNRRLSDYYSVEIWGLNVRNMYDYMKAKFETQEDEHDKNTSGENLSNLRLVANVESVISALYDKWNKAYSEFRLHGEEGINEYVLYEKLIDKAIDESGLNEAVSDSILNKFPELNIRNKSDYDFERLYLPKYCPWFTIQEMIDMGIDPHTEYKTNLEYYNALKEACNAFKELPTSANKQRILNLGWNPYISLTEKAFDEAKTIQGAFFMSRLGISESFDHEACNNTDPHQYKDEELNYVVMQARNEWDTDRNNIRQMCTYYKNLGY